VLLRSNFSRTSLLAMVAGLILLGAGSSARGQCVLSPTGETAVRFKNVSSYRLTFRVDEDRTVTTPAGRQSVDLAISPGEHALFARASSGEELAASRAVVIVEGMVCTWTVTDPESEAREVFLAYRDSLRLQAVIPLAIPN
jgi:hypothetical protein